MHGDRSTGPGTLAGKQRCRAARTTHGFRTHEQRAFRSFCVELLAEARLLTRSCERRATSQRQNPIQSGGTGVASGHHGMELD
jgi:hypothetical protein